MRSKPDDAKLTELILYVAEKCEGDERFGETKLNRLLFYIDFFAYLTLGNPVTGQEYQILERGPAPTRSKTVQERMVANDELRIRERNSYGNLQYKPLALRPANLDIFEKKEIALIDDCIARFWRYDAAALCEESKQLFPWRNSLRGESIPYELALVHRREPTEQELEWGKDLERLAFDTLTK